MCGGVQFHRSVGRLFLGYWDCDVSCEPALSAAGGGEGLMGIQNALPAHETCLQYCIPVGLSLLLRVSRIDSSVVVTSAAEPSLK